MYVWMFVVARLGNIFNMLTSINPGNICDALVNMKLELLLVLTPDIIKDLCIY